MDVIEIDNICLIQQINFYDSQKIIAVAPGACIIKLFTAVIYGLCNKLACLSLNTKLGWKGLPWTNTLTETVKYGSNKFYDTGSWCSVAVIL